MYKSDISVLDNCTGKIRKHLCPDATVTLTSKIQQWRKIRVEQQYLPPSETPEMTSQSHLICVHQSAPLWLEYKEDDRWHDCLMKPGEIFLIPAGTAHAARWQESGELLILALNPDSIAKVAPEAVSGRNIELIPYKGQPDGLIANIAWAFKEELETGGSEELYRDSLMNALIARLLRNYSATAIKDEVQGGLGKRKLQLVLNYIQAHLTEEITLTQMAEVVGLSRFHFSRMFKESMGTSPNRYVNHCRIEKAKQLLHQHQISINQISQACGYTTASYFIKQFHKATGVTPNVYRNG